MHFACKCFHLLPTGKMHTHRNANAVYKLAGMQILCPGKKGNPKRLVNQKGFRCPTGNMHSQERLSDQLLVAMERSTQMPFLMGGRKKWNVQRCCYRCCAHLSRQKYRHIRTFIRPWADAHAYSAYSPCWNRMKQLRHKRFQIPDMLKQAIALAKASFSLLNGKYLPKIGNNAGFIYTSNGRGIAACIHADICVHSACAPFSVSIRLASVPSMPLMYAEERSPPKRFANSTASLIETLHGIS